MPDLVQELMDLGVDVLEADIMAGTYDHDFVRSKMRKLKGRSLADPTRFLSVILRQDANQQKRPQDRSAHERERLLLIRRQQAEMAAITWVRDCPPTYEIEDQIDSILQWLGALPPTPGSAQDRCRYWQEIDADPIWASKCFTFGCVDGGQDRMNILDAYREVYPTPDPGPARWGHGQAKMRKRPQHQAEIDLDRERKNRVSRRVMLLPEGAYIYCPLCHGRMERAMADHGRYVLRCKKSFCQGRRPATRIERRGRSCEGCRRPMELTSQAGPKMRFGCQTCTASGTRL